MKKSYSYKCKACGLNGYTHSPLQRYCYGCSYDRNQLGIVKPDQFDDNGRRVSAPSAKV
jgi:hypothetical protein